MKNKRSYKAPQVKKVQLEVKNAILAVCHTSPDQTPRGEFDTPCSITPDCFSGPGT